MTITKTLASKLFVAFVAIAFALSLVAPAQAQTEEELQAQIDALMETINSLNAQLGEGGGDSMSGGSSASVCPYAWTRSLSTGSTGADVMALQKFLNADAATQVAASGVGSAGQETDYYGGLTAAAVSNFQVMYRDDILTPVGLVNPTGYFGPSTMAKANALCASAPADDMMDDDMKDDDDDDDDDDKELSGEADLDKAEISGADDDDIEEGAEDAPLAELEVEFSDGDGEISRIDVRLVSAGASGDETDPWDTFETLSLWVDGDKVAEENADDEDDWLDEDTGEFRFSGLDLVGEEDEDFTVVLAGSLNGSIDGTNNGNTWAVSFEAIRFFDADGVATTEDSTDDLGGSTGAHDNTENFTIDEEGGEDEVVVRTSTNDPDGTTLQLEDDSDSDWYSVFIFDLDTDDSVNDIEFNEVVVSVELSSSTFASIVDDAELVIDGVTIDDYTASSSGTQSDLTFDVDGDVTVDAGDRVEAELMLKFNSLGPGNEGITVQGRVTAADRDAIDAEGADDLDTSQLSGAATGDQHTLRTQGVDVDAGDIDADVTVNDGSTDDYATYSMELEVTAFEQDVYISTNPATAIAYVLEDGAGSTTVAGSQTVTITSSGDEVGSAFEITEGSTETITITVTYVPGVANVAARMNLNTLTFGSSSGSPTGQSWTASPNEDFRTGVVTIVD